MAQQIILTGPESTGKTTLGEALAAHYTCPMLPESARAYLEMRSGKYEYEDLANISDMHADHLALVVATASKIMILDTGQEVLYIWSMHKYGKVDTKITSRLKSQAKAYHLICKPDVAWVPDPLRESKEERDVLFKKYEELMKNSNLSYDIVEGEGEQRLQNAIRLIENFVSRSS
jgi:nicotinamide riboside kinase